MNVQKHLSENLTRLVDENIALAIGARDKT